MFHYDGGIKITRAGLAVDDRRRQPRGFVSHAHADHMARHEWAYATPATAALYRHRLGDRLQVQPMPFGKPIELGSLQLTTYPAGHCLGSAMLLADDGQTRLLYTGDFKLGSSYTARPAELPQADILIMESTFGIPRYRMPPREQVIEELVTTIRAALAAGKTPVVHAYALGKSQEVTAILHRAGIPVLQHPKMAQVSAVYEKLGVDLGDWAPYESKAAGGPAGGSQAVEGHVVMTLPQSAKGFRLAGLQNVVSIAVTGWAIDPSTQHRLGVDVALPLSDHADFDELIETARRVAPREIYCTHGPAEFVGHLQKAGFNAFPLVPESQRSLFS